MGRGGSGVKSNLQWCLSRGRGRRSRGRWGRGWTRVIRCRAKGEAEVPRRPGRRREINALECLVEEQPSAPIACIIGRVSSDQFDTSPSVMKTYWWVIFYPHRSNWHSSGSGKWTDETAFYHDTPYGRKYLYVWKLFEMQYPRRWGNVNLSIVEGGIESAWYDPIIPTVPWHCHGVYTNIWHIVVVNEP